MLGMTELLVWIGNELRLRLASLDDAVTRLVDAMAEVFELVAHTFIDVLVDQIARADLIDDGVEIGGCVGECQARGFCLMPLSAPLGDGPRATAVTIPRFPSTLAAGIGICVTGAAGRTSGAPLSTPVGLGWRQV